MAWKYCLLLLLSSFASFIKSDENACLSENFNLNNGFTERRNYSDYNNLHSCSLTLPQFEAFKLNSTTTNYPNPIPTQPLLIKLCDFTFYVDSNTINSKIFSFCQDFELNCNSQNGHLTGNLNFIDGGFSDENKFSVNGQKLMLDWLIEPLLLTENENNCGVFTENIFQIVTLFEIYSNDWVDDQQNKNELEIEAYNILIKNIFEISWRSYSNSCLENLELRAVILYLANILEKVGQSQPKIAKLANLYLQQSNSIWENNVGDSSAIFPEIISNHYVDASEIQNLQNLLKYENNYICNFFQNYTSFTEKFTNFKMGLLTNSIADKITKFTNYYFAESNDNDYQFSLQEENNYNCYNFHHFRGPFNGENGVNVSSIVYPDVENSLKSSWVEILGSKNKNPNTSCEQLAITRFVGDENKYLIDNFSKNTESMTNKITEIHPDVDDSKNYTQIHHYLIYNNDDDTETRDSFSYENMKILNYQNNFRLRNLAFNLNLVVEIRLSNFKNLEILEFLKNIKLYYLTPKNLLDVNLKGYTGSYSRKIPPKKGF